MLSKYYIVDYIKYNKKHRITLSSEDLKQECIKILDNRGWDNKQIVDLRSGKSMINYLFENVTRITKV